MIFYLRKNFKTIEDLKGKLGSFYEEFYLIRGPKVFLLKINYFVRRLVVAYSVVYINNIVLQMYAMYLFVLIQTILICYIRPYEEGRLKMNTEIFNEIMIIFTSYTIISFTDWVPDINSQEIMGFVTLILVALHLLVNLGLMLFKSVKQLWLIFKKYVVNRIQKFRAQRELIKKTMERLEAEAKAEQMQQQQQQQNQPAGQVVAENDSDDSNMLRSYPSFQYNYGDNESKREQQEEQKQQKIKKDDAKIQQQEESKSQLQNNQRKSQVRQDIQVVIQHKEIENDRYSIKKLEREFELARKGKKPESVDPEFESQLAQDLHKIANRNKVSIADHKRKVSDEWNKKLPEESDQYSNRPSILDVFARNKQELSIAERLENQESRMIQLQNFGFENLSIAERLEKQESRMNKIFAECDERNRENLAKITQQKIAVENNYSVLKQKDDRIVPRWQKRRMMQQQWQNQTEKL